MRFEASQVGLATPEPFRRAWNIISEETAAGDLIWRRRYENGIANSVQKFARLAHAETSALASQYARRGWLPVIPNHGRTKSYGKTNRGSAAPDFWPNL